VYGTVLSFTTSGGGTCYGYNCGNTGQAPLVNTKNSNYASQNSSVLYGEVNPNNGLTTAWFEYGTTYSLGSRTSDYQVGSGNYYQQYSSPVSGLAYGTTYYFRAVAQNQWGTSYGQILSFRTQDYYINQPVYQQPIYQPQVLQYPIYQPTYQQVPIQVPVYQQVNIPVYRETPTYTTPVAPASGLSCITLIPTLNATQLHAGQEFTYTITYRNGCNFNLKDASLQVAIPSEAEFLSSSNPYFVREGNTLIYNLGNVEVNGQVAVNIRARVVSTAKVSDNLIFGAILNFTDSKARFQTIVAYLTAFVIDGQTVSVNGNVFGASLGAAFAGLIASGWLTFLLIVLLFVTFLWLLLDRSRRPVIVSEGLKGIRVE